MRRTSWDLPVQGPGNTGRVWSRLVGWSRGKDHQGSGGHAGGTRSHSRGLNGRNVIDNNKEVRRGDGGGLGMTSGMVAIGP